LESSQEEKSNAEFEATLVGTILKTGPGTVCERFNFDNESGQITPDFRPCDITAGLDNRGFPVPAGSARRLDAISKSFLSK
jgi:hypothetical protein